MLYIVKQYKALLGALLRNRLIGEDGGSFIHDLDNFLDTDSKEPKDFASLQKKAKTPEQKKAINTAQKKVAEVSNTNKEAVEKVTTEVKGQKAKLDKEVTPSAFTNLDLATAQQTLQYLNALSNTSLKNGDGWAKVSQLQYALLGLWYNLWQSWEFNNWADGIYGSKVKAAVRGVQTELELDVTGSFTSTTFDKLKSELTLVVESKKSEKTVATQSEGSAYKDQPEVVSALSEADIAAHEAEIAKQREALMNEINSDQTQEVNTELYIPYSRPTRQNKMWKWLDLADRNREKEVTWIKRTELLDRMNVALLHDLLRSENLEEIYNDAFSKVSIKEITDDDGVITKVAEYNGIWKLSNFSETAKVLKSAWYDDAKGFWWLDGEEMWALMLTIRDQIRTQKNIPTMSAVGKMKILFDFDGDTHLESDSKEIDGMNYVSEKQITRDTFKWITSNGYNILLENLGLPNIETEMAQNLFTAREKFHRELGTMFERGYKLGELLVEGWVQRATEMMYGKENEKAEAISKIVEEKLIPRLEAEAGQELTPEERKQIKLLAIGVMTWGVTWVGASFDIKDYVKVVDSLQVGLFNGVPWVGISKKLWEKNGFEFTGSVVNFYIPVLTAQYHDEPSLEKVKQTFEEEFEGDWTISPSISITVGAYLPSIAFTYENKDTSKGIDKRVDNMWDVLDKMFKDIQEWKSFDDISYIESKWKEENSIYNKMKDTYDTYGASLTEEQQVLFMRDLKQGGLNYYKMGLYNNASKSNFDINAFWIWRWLGDFNPLTFIYVGWENLSLDWKKVIHSIDREREVTTTRIALEKIWAEVVEYKGFKVLAIPNGSEYAISSDENIIQAEYDKGNDMLYITGDIRNISVAEYSMAHWAQKTIVVWKWVTNEKGMLLDTTENLVSIDSNLWFNIDYSAESLEKTEIARDHLFTIIDSWTLKDPKTPGMMALQKAIFNYKRTWTPTISESWDKFIKVFNDPEMKSYASWEKENALKGLLLYIQNTDITNEDKVLILQSVSSNLMKKKALKIKGTKVMIEWGESTLMEYDTNNNRSDFFDPIFERELSDIAADIKGARTEYLKANGDKREYTFTSIAEWDIAFTGVFSKRWDWEDNVNGLMPYTWVYKVASFEWGVDMVPIEGKSINIIDALPTGYLENVKTILEEITWQSFRSDNVDDPFEKVKIALKSKDTPIKFEYDLFFAKMSECLNDAVIMKNLKMTVGDNKVTLWASSTSEVYTPEYAAQKWALWFTENKKDDGNGDDDTRTPPPGGNTTEWWGWSGNVWGGEVGGGGF